MYKYSTPTLIFNTNIDLQEASMVELTMKDRNNNIVIFNMDRLNITESKIELCLLDSDLETLCIGTVEMQVRYSVRECVPYPSNIMYIPLENPLSSKVISHA